jgi:phenylalanyl-tRNA synthetase beta chain
MKIAYKVLQEFVKTSLSPADLGEKFLMTSSELESLTDWGKLLEGLVVGKVEEVRPHPNADRLRLATLNIGKQKIHVVCGAPNLAVGQTVVVALPGTQLTPLKGEPVLIDKTTVRGEPSMGMICTPDEIGIPFQSEGIILLSDSCAPGSSAAAAMHLEDVVLDLEVTPNRPDLLSYRGLAREVATFEKRPLKEQPIAALNELDTKESSPVKVSIEDSKLCQRYSGVCLENITIAPSPQWLAARLTLSGIRPVNNVVDVVNYVMLELGQPMHAFDLDSLPSMEIIAGTVQSKTTLQLLDGTEREVLPSDITIRSGNKVIGLAGVMGGSETEVSPETTRILLESATFYGPQIRRTSRRLGLRSEASSRFEKGLDPEITITALKRAVYLLTQLAGAQVKGSVIDVYPKSRGERPRIHLTFALSLIHI